MDGRISNLLAIILIFSLLLNFFVPLSSALEENSTPALDNDNGMPPDDWPFPPLPEVSPDLPDNSLISHWTFDNVQGNLVGNEVTSQEVLVMYGDAHQINDGRVGKAMHFDGDGDVIENQMLWGELQQLSIALWVKADNLEGFLWAPPGDWEWSHPAPLAKAWFMNSPGEFYLNTVDNGKNLYFGIFTSTSRYDLVAEDVNFAIGEWCHIAATYDGQRMTIFIDGENVASKDASGTLPQVDIPLMIGRDGRCPRWWDGAIDEVGIYNHGLIPEEVLKLYQEAAAPAVDNTPPSSSVLPFEGDDYWKKIETIGSGSFTVSAEATDDLSVVESVELWYRYSLDNWTDEVAWKKRGWQRYSVDTDNTDGWSWSFVPDSYGHYEFFSVATDAAGNRENEDVKMLERGEANVRVAEDLVRVAVIFAEPQNIPVNEQRSYDRSHIQSAWVEASDGLGGLRSYYDEVSYGALALQAIDVYDDAGQLFKLDRSHDYYGSSTGHPWATQKDFVVDAIKKADGIIDYDGYTMVIAFPGPIRPGGVAFGDDYETSSEMDGERDKARNYIFLKSGVLATLAHEVGHQLGRVLREDRTQLLDLGGEPGHGGDVDGWGLMGSGAPSRVHLSSWSKWRLGWLNFDEEDLLLTEEYYAANRDLAALPCLSYGDSVYIYKIDRVDDWWFGNGKNIWYLLEARTTDDRYSSWDGGVPDNRLVIYQVENHWDWWGAGQWTTVNVVSQLGVEGEVSYDLGKGVRFSADDFNFGSDEFWIEYTIDYPLEEGSTTTTLYPMTPYRLSENTAPQDGSSLSPDLDLHAFTIDGKHVGMNYETGVYEVEIPSVRASGDLYQGTEWITMPDNTKTFFVASSRDVAEFMRSSAAPELENENSLYAVRVTYKDSMGGWYTSAVIPQEIEPGSEVYHEFSVTPNPDGTYSVEVEQGMDLLSLEAWQAAIDNIPDNVFVRNPAQRKQALKEKFEEVFEEISEAQVELAEEDGGEGEVGGGDDAYEEAIEKLEYDILRKLDADGQTDWVTQPVLVDEIKALAEVLKSKSG